MGYTCLFKPIFYKFFKYIKYVKGNGSNVQKGNKM